MAEKKASQQPKMGKRAWLEGRTYQEEDPPLTDDEVRRQLGFDLLPINGGDREVQD
jgi:hypothetical protein